MEFREHTLPNGLEIVAECNPEARTTALGFFVKTGARDEADDTAGVSHFLEHMVFKGTPRRSADDVNRQFDEMGAHYNAFTSKEGTVYYAAVLPEYQDAALDLLADIMRPSLRTEDFDMEKQVIVEEIHMYEDQPPFCADEKCEAVLYGAHPLGRSVLGTVDTVTGLTVEAMRDYFQSRYSPGNIALVGAGQIEFDRFVREADRHCGGWEPFAAPRELAPPRTQCEFHALHKDSAALEYIIQLAEAPGALDETRYAAKVLSAVLGDSSGSRLYWELVDPGLADSAVAGHVDYQETGLFMTSVSCRAERTEENLQRVLNIYRDAEAHGVTEAELGQAKNKINAHVVLGSERPRVRLFSVGSNWIQRRQYRSMRDDLSAVEAVTTADLSAVLERFPLSRNTTFAIGPLTHVAAPR